MMDWHRCIGCRYCIAACPYGSRSFNWTDPRPYIERIDHRLPTRSKGVVEKCTFCEERLAVARAGLRGGVPEKALVFGDLEDPPRAGAPGGLTRRDLHRFGGIPGLGTRRRSTTSCEVAHVMEKALKGSRTYWTWVRCCSGSSASAFAYLRS